MNTDEKKTGISHADAAAIDALVEAGFDTKSLGVEHAPRGRRIADLLSLLDFLPDQDGGALLRERTMHRIARARKPKPQQETEPVATFGPRMRIGELLALAAALLLAMSILSPMLENARGAARQLACQQNLAAAGLGFSSYADDFNDALPATAHRVGDPWWLIGRFDNDGYAKSNSAHLFTLARLGYVTPTTLCCVEATESLEGTNPDALRQMRDWPSVKSVSYSYQNQYTPSPRRLTRGRTIALLADKNPFFDSGEKGTYRVSLGQVLRDSAVSANHAGRGGHNVLLTSGSVPWLPGAMLGDDNIYHVGSEGLDDYTGLESPNDSSDSFLVW